jgi:hypothetical protein
MQSRLEACYRKSSCQAELLTFPQNATFPYVAFYHLLRHVEAKEINMPQSVKLSDELIKQARKYGDVFHRSTAKQIEYWSTIGKISEENPDLPYSFIKDILLAQNEVLGGDVTPYEFE